ncbi:MAG: ribosome silencing factor [bacterium]
MALKKISFRKLAVKAAHAADAKKAEDIVILDIRKITAIADYLLLITGTSSPHVRNLQEEIQKAFDSSKVRLLHHEGRKGSMWHVLDYGGVVIHIMGEELRQFYALDKLWQDARKLSWLKNL